MNRQMEGILLHPRELKQEMFPFKVSFINKTHWLFALEAYMVLSFLITNTLLFVCSLTETLAELKPKPIFMTLPLYALISIQ